MKNYDICRKNMVDGQLRTNGIIDKNLLDVFENLPREVFLPPEKAAMAYVDEDVKLDGSGTFLMEPLVFARMVNEANIRPDDIVLNIGDNIGYSSAFLSAVASTVVTLESKAGRLDKARKVWDDLDLCNIAVVKGQANEGSKVHSPYSLIVINGSVPFVPDGLLAQLSGHGRLITVIQETENSSGYITLYKALGDGRYTHTRLYNASTPSLPGFMPEREFVF